MSHSNPPEAVQQPATLEAVQAAHRYCDLARAAILPHFRTATPVENKSDEANATGAFGYDPVTQADREAEQRIRTAIERDFPSDGFIGEETGSVRLKAEHRWIVDPIDGTRAFVTGSPLWGTLIARLKADQPKLGFMDQPFTQERFWSDGLTSFYARGNGEQIRDGEKIATRQNVDLAQATLSTTHPDLFPTRDTAKAFKAVASKVKTVRYGGDCYGYALLANGGIDVIIEAGLKVYDIAALIPIIECAGGVITDWNGNRISDGGNVVASGSQQLHAQVLDALKV
ncbi:MAG: histidinol-phosphatase [Pseudomonadota bacterium]